MDVFYPTAKTPASPDYVLSVIRDFHRQQCEFDCAANPDATLTFDTTLDEWREACDLLPWRELGEGLNEIWGIAVSPTEWKAVLEPGQTKRLSDVCEFLAERVLRPEIRPADLLGRPCITAGAFLTIRSLLHRAGAEIDEIAPSTPLAPYTRRYARVFLTEISTLAPGALPPVKIFRSLYDLAVGCLPVGLVVLVAGCWADVPTLTFAGAAIFALAYALSWVAACCTLPGSVTFGSLQTFRDLAVALSGGDDRKISGIKKSCSHDSWDRW